MVKGTDYEFHVAVENYFSFRMAFFRGQLAPNSSEAPSAGNSKNPGVDSVLEVFIACCRLLVVTVRQSNCFHFCRFELPHRSQNVSM